MYYNIFEFISICLILNRDIQKTLQHIVMYNRHIAKAVAWKQHVDNACAVYKCHACILRVLQYLVEKLTPKGEFGVFLFFYTLPSR